MSVTYEPIDVIETGVSRMMWELQTGENHVKFLTLFLKQIQEVEDTFFQILDAGNIDLAEGVQLDLIGYILGVTRNGMDDSTFRDYLKFQVIVNTADTTYESIYNAFFALTSSEDIRIIEAGTAFGCLFFSGKDAFNSTAKDLMENVKAAGTRWLVKGDFYSNCLLFAWEKPNAHLEPFYVTDDGNIYNQFNVTEDGTVYEPFLVGDSTTTNIVQSTIKGKRNILGWEGDTDQSIENLRFLSWEITEGSTMPEDLAWLFTLENVTNHIYDYANYTLPSDLG